MKIMSTKYKAWKIGSEDETKETLYADSHRKAAMKYAEKHGISWVNVETQKVGR